jgi:SAM-dependent methyltransferase
MVEVCQNQTLASRLPHLLLDLNQGLRHYLPQSTAWMAIRHTATRLPPRLVAFTTKPRSMVRKDIKRFLGSAYYWLTLLGIDPLRTIGFMRGLPPYLCDLKTLKKQTRNAVKEFPLGKAYPCLEDRFSGCGLANGHYFHQDLLVARRIHINTPATHVDVGSRVDGFIAHVASFRPIEVIDIRPLSSHIPNVKFLQADFMSPIHNDLVDYCDSLSCLHAIEHFGLGRYGDPVNYDGYLLGLSNLYHVLKNGGKFYFATPIGPQRIEFNAHRVFSVRYLLELFDGKYQVDQFSYVDDHGALHENVPLLANDVEANFGCVYGCGIFELTKLC